MARTRIMYIENKSGENDLVGEARIGRVTFSKSGSSIHYRSKTFITLSGSGFKSNYADTETGEHYWISGCKKNGQDRLYGERLPIYIDDDATRMATINFSIRTQNNPAKIYVRLREGKNIDVKAPTKFLIDPKNWSKTKGRAKANSSEHLKKVNNDLDFFKGRLVNQFNERQSKDEIDIKWLKAFIDPSLKLTDNLITEDLIGYFDIYRDSISSNSTVSTLKKCNVIKQMLVRMQNDLKKILLIRNVDLNFKFEFEQFCDLQGYAPNTVARALKFIKTVCRHARTNGIETHHQLDDIKVRFQKVEHIHLSLDDLKKIEEAANLPEHLDNAKDWLLISCYTGQRISDFMRFKKEWIRTEQRKKLIDFTQKKTRKIMTIPLHSKVLSILEKRNNEFPRPISDQKYNEYIKEVCKRASLTMKVKGSRKNPDTKRKEEGNFEKWQLVASHIGRRSFATNYYGNIPTALLMNATGHSSESQFLTYIGKTDSQKAVQLADYF